MKNRKTKTRTKEQLQEHYLIERELADKLRNASSSERTKLYTKLYNELYLRVPNHPQNTGKVSINDRVRAIKILMSLIKPFINENTTYLELGPGDCALAFEVAKNVKKVYAIDVSDEITKYASFPANFELIISNGTDVNVKKETVDVAFSNQLMEHLHPDDAINQLNNVFASLKRGGKYICITPNRLSGPHDISMYFDEEATGFHMKEYTTMELIELFKETGFKEVETYIGTRGYFIKFPTSIIEKYEKFLTSINSSKRKKFSFFPLRVLLGIILVGKK